MKVKMITLGAMLVLIGIVITGCTGLSRQSADQTGTELSGVANGERIYFTGLDGKGEQIP